MIAKGKVLKYGDHINTDLIIPARYLNTSNAQELAHHCMEDVDTKFQYRVKPGDIMVAGQNFGSGSSREHAAMAIKASGIACVIAANFARIFFRNAVNIGLAILECPEAAEKIHDGDTIEIDFDKGVIRNLSQEGVYQAQPFPRFIQEILSAGGLVEAIKKKMMPEDSRRNAS